MPLNYPIHRTVLDNGLRVVISPDHSVPAVTVNMWVNVGSRHEPQGATGFAHLFEHLMFQGSRHVAEGEHFTALMSNGGRANATTWFDRTNYFETVPTGALELALWLEADRHANLLDAVTQANLDNQRDVVKEEKRQRYDNHPYGYAMADVYANAFPVGHPYAHPTIGSMEDLDAASLDRVHDFYRKFYGPKNTVISVVGDVTADEGLALVEKYFGGWSHDTIAARPPHVPLPPLTGVPRLERREDLPNDRLYAAFRLPADCSPGFDAAALALDAIGGLASSRLYKRLLRHDELATGLSASAMGLLDGTSLGLIVVDVDEDADPRAVEDALVEELARFADEGPSEVELAAALADTERAWLSSLASQEERADLINQFHLLHDDHEHINTWFDHIAQITTEDVHQAARQWLSPESRGMVAYLRAEESSAEGDLSRDMVKENA